MKVTFSVPGDPKPWQRPVHSRGNTFTPEESKDYQRTVATYARLAMRAAGFRMTKEAVALTADFIVPDRRRRDSDNLVKQVMDSLIGVTFLDDSQVMEIHVTKRVAENQEPTGATVTVEIIPQPDAAAAA